jgi:hypothetical protein
VGSFSEAVLSFWFRPDAPPEIVAAFAPWRTTALDDEDAPDLPDLDPLVDEREARFHVQESSALMAALLMPLGRYAAGPTYDRDRFFVGYVRHEYDPRPLLLWLRNGEHAFRVEDLNTG